MGVRLGRRSARGTPFDSRKAFFFEKKKQKTFAPAPASPDEKVVDLARNQTGKSFLVLFFKKEQTFVQHHTSRNFECRAP
jgi:hypothetical protein